MVAILVLAVEGYLIYGYYERYYGAGIPSSEAAISATPRAATTDDSPSDKPAEQEEPTLTALVHRSTPDNTVRNSTYIDHPQANGNPDAILLVTQNQEREGGVTNAHPTGVWYDANRGGRWAIFNQDLAPMPKDAVFGVIIQEDAGEAFVHRARPANTTDNATYLDHPLADENPAAVLSVTPNWNPGGGPGLYNDHLAGARYDAGERRWAVINQDLDPLPRNAAFNVLVSEDGTRN